LRRAGGLRPVADHAGDDSQSVDDRGGDLLPAAPAQPGRRRGHAAGGARRAAVGREPAYVPLDVHRDEVADEQRPEQLLAAAVPGLRQRDDRQGHRQSLIAAAGVYDHRHQAAAHPRVAARGGHGGGADIGAVVRVLQQGAAYVQAVFTQKALDGYGPVALDLAFKQLPLRGKVRALGVVQNTVEAPTVVVRTTGGLLLS